MEHAPFPRSALHPDFSAHLVHKFHANSQTKTGSPILPRRRAIRLDKRFEDELLFILRYPRPGITDRKVQRDLSSVTAFALDLYGDFPARGKLDRVIDEISNDLPKPVCVAHKCVGYFGIDPHGRVRGLWRERGPQESQESCACNRAN